MYTSRKCDDYESCESYIAAMAGGNCSVCGMRKKGEYAPVIAAEDAAIMAADLEEQRRANPDLASADAEMARARFPNVKNGGKV